ncbi:hypothetical protein [Ruegeria sp. HKCCA4633]|uniref:hypothetical protein n=1 Tax=Ruegeria sp. HKCCA4633 TaxID=2682983 RepID=UPI0014888051|nr:hypothetical protein [Ruegeria sp. HKCCA4633]
MTNDERTTAIGLFNYAHSYWASASVLQGSNLDATHPDAPVNYLYFHAIELFLKAYLRSKGLSVADIKNVGHKMERLAEKATELGLELTDQDQEVIALIGPNYLPARYIVVGAFTRARPEALWGTCSCLFDSIGEELRRQGKAKRLPIRPNHPSEAVGEKG